ncbi:MAG TPA: hypothetical protein VLF67_00965 [Candidatus Saccharimonas sp.]|nr:hypothetical protein [Candidatus Saccharimonas sp.]
MHLITRLLSGLLVLALVVGAAAWVLSATVWNASYLMHKADDTHLADGLAAALPEALASNTSTSSDTKYILTQVITPSLVRDQLDTMLPALITFFERGGQAPRLDLREIESRITAAGYDVPAELKPALDTPQSVGTTGAGPGLRSAIQQTGQLKWWAPLAAVVLAGLIVLVAGHRRWLALAEAAFFAGLLTLAAAGLAQFLPALVDSMLTTSPAKALAAPVRAFATAVSGDVSRDFLYVAAGLGALVLVLGALHLFFRFFHHPAAEAKAAH